MTKEMEFLHKYHTWESVKSLANQMIVGYKWVFKKKFGASRMEEMRYRLVTKGYTQRYRVYFNHVFSPIVKHNSIIVFLTLITKFDLELEQLDVKIAFLHGKLEETIYMRQLEGFMV